MNGTDEDGFDRLREAARTWCAAQEDALSPAGAACRAVVIAASDLPVDAGVLTAAAPGTLYQLRLPGALVPPSAEADADAADAAVAAGLEYGLRLAGARHVLVLTHAGCGLIGALLEESGERAMAMARDGALRGWAALAAPAIGRTAGSEAPDADRRRFAAMEIVRLSIENLLSYPFLLDAVLARDVALHGWCLDAENRALWTLDPAEDVFLRA